MIKVISASEFMSHQGKYLDLVKKGIDVIIKSRDRGSFRITPVAEDDTLMTKEEFFERVDKGVKQVENGQSYEMLVGEDLEEFLDRVKLIEDDL